MIAERQFPPNGEIAFRPHSGDNGGGGEGAGGIGIGDWGLRIANCGLRIADCELRIADEGLAK